MKISKFSKFFGNRFAAKRAAFLSSEMRNAAAATTSFSEFEVLESRILLSGIGTGVDQKRVQFTDADGDLVTVSVRGEGSAFDIQLVGGVEDGADIESISVKGEGASLGVSVAPQGFETDQITPGFSTIGQITAAAGVGQINSISLSAAVASKIDLGDAEVGSISLTTGQTAKVDALTGGGFEGASSQEQISFQTISTGSVGALRLSGGADGANNFQGNITATIGDIGQLWGPNSTMFGNLHFGGADAALGSVNLGGGFDYGTQISADGNFTFLADGFDGTINVEGHLNFGVGELGVIGDIYAGGGVSGLKASTQDALLIGGIFSADLQTIGDIADVRLTGGGYLDYAIIEGVNIGTISSRGDGVGLGYGNIIRASGDLAGIELRRASLVDGNTFDVSGQIGEIDIINGSLDGLLTAGSFGEVRVSNGSIYGSLVALAGDIGRVEVKEGSIYGSIQALQGGIGEVSALTSQNWTALGGKISAQFIGPVSAINLGDGFAIGGSDMQIFATYDIAGITAMTNGAVAIGDYASVQAGGALGDINVTALSTYSYDSAAISNVYVQADSIGAITVASSTGQGIAYSEFVAVGGDIGPISITSRTGGVTYSSFTSYKGAIGNLNITNLGPKSEVLSSRAVSYAVFDAGTSIGAVSVISGGAGLYNADFMARNGSIGDVNIDAVTEGIGYGSSFTAAFTATGAPDPSPYDIASLSLFDGGNIGNITVLSRGAIGNGYAGISDTFFEASGSIGDVNIAWTGDGLRGTSIVAGGEIGSITVASEGLYGSYTAVASSNVSARGSIGAIVVNSAGAGVYESAFTAFGSIGIISVNSIGAGVYESNFSAGGDIGLIDVQAAGTGIGGMSGGYGSSFTAGSFIGGISVVSTAQVGSAYTAIYNANFSAEVGIGDISIESVGEGLRYASFVSGGSVGLFSVTSKGSNGSAYTAVSYSSVSADGSINGIAINSAGAGVYQSNFSAGGDVGFIDVQAAGTAVGGMFGYNSGSSFTAGGSIGSVSVISAGQYGSGYAAVYNADFSAGAEIGSINVRSAGEGMRYASFASGGNIGSVSVTSQGLAYYGGTYTAVAYSSVSASGAIGGISVNSAGAGVYESNFSAGGDIGYIDVQAAGTAIGGLSGYGSSFTAGAFIGGINVVSTGGNGSGYAAIYNAGFSAGVHIDSINVESSGDGMRNTFVVAGGGIGSLSVTAQALNPYGGIYTAVAYSSVSAVEGGIGTIAVSSSGVGVYESFFSAGLEIGSIEVVASQTAVGGLLDYGSVFAAAAIGGIDVNSTAAGYAAIDNASFAADDYIGDINVSSAGDGMRNTVLVAFAGSIGQISVTTEALGDYGAAHTAIAYSSVLAKGNISGIAVTSSGQGIHESAFIAGSDIGYIDVSASDVAIGGQLGYGSSFVAGDGSIGSVDVVSTGTYDAGFTAVYNATFDAGIFIGNINIESAGEGARNAFFSALSGIGNVNVASLGVAYGGSSTALVDSGFVSDEGSIGAVSVTSAGDGMHAASFKAPIGIIGSVDVEAGSTGIIDSSFSAGAAIGNVSVTAAGDGIASASFTSGSIADISINSGFNSRLNLNAAQVGSVSSFGHVVDWATLTLDLGPDTLSLGPVTVGANLAIVGDFAALENLGAVSVGGSILLNTSLASVQTASTISAASILGGQTIGAGQAGSSIGLVTIANGDFAANSVTFNFETMNGISNVTADGTVVVDFLNGSESDITAFAAALPGGATSAGVTAILV